MIVIRNCVAGTRHTMDCSFIKIDPTQRVNNGALSEFNWGMCMLCQKEKCEKLTNPRNSTRDIDGYASLSNRLLEFFDIGQLPYKIPEYILFPKEGTLTQSMKDNIAVWHALCYKNCSSSRLELARKRVPEKSTKNASPVKTRSSNPEWDKNSCIFHNIFCGENGAPDLTHVKLGCLYRVETQECNDKIKELAASLNDSRITNRLQGASDLMALDARYHNVCLLVLKNRVRAKDTLKRHQEESNRTYAHSIALSKLISYIKSVKASMPPHMAPEFKMSDLTRRYEHLMKEMGVSCVGHSSRLKSELIESCDSRLAASGSGPGRKGTSIIFECDANKAITFLSAHSFTAEHAHYVNAATNLRKAMFAQNEKDPTSIANDVSLFVKMVLDGPTSDYAEKDAAISTLSHLFTYHTVKRPDKRSAVVKRSMSVRPEDENAPVAKLPKRRHDVNRELAAIVPVYVGLKVYAETRKKGLIEDLNEIGVSISYKRVMTIVADAASKVSETYYREGVVCPPSLRRGVFTTTQADNFDYNPSSNTAKDAFHGTVISMAQHFQRHNKGMFIHCPVFMPLYVRKGCPPPLFDVRYGRHADAAPPIFAPN